MIVPEITSLFGLATLLCVLPTILFGIYVKGEDPQWNPRQPWSRHRKIQFCCFCAGAFFLVMTFVSLWVARH